MMKVLVVFVALVVYGSIADESLQGDVIASSSLETNVIASSSLETNVIASSSLETNAIASSSLETEVTKGRPITIQEWKSIAALQRGAAAIFTHACTGSILTASFILTTARCFEDWSDPSLWRIRLGTAIASTAATRQVTDITKHPDWNPTTFENDIALLHTTPRIIFSETIGQIILAAPGSSIPTGVWARVAGWGSRVGGLASATLLAGNLEVVDQQDCEDMYNELEDGGGGNITNRMFCTRVPPGVGNGCVGDLGSPITVNNGLVAGLVSWGYGCVAGGFGGVNTLISSHILWIDDVVRSI